MCRGLEDFHIYIYFFKLHNLSVATVLSSVQITAGRVSLHGYFYTEKE